jgi:hypothetical protein
MTIKRGIIDMKRIIGLIAVLASAATAALALAAVAATNASAQPEFLGLAGVSDIHFTGEGGLATLRAKRGGMEGTVECHKLLVSGLILVPSMLIDKILFHFHTGCEETLNGTKTECTEPILSKLLMGDLGWTKNTAPLTPVGILLRPETGKVNASVTCGSNVTTVEGEIVIEIPETSKTVNQYNTFLTKYELVVKSTNANTQETPETFELLGGPFMTGVKLKVEGFFGEGATENGSSTITLAHDGEIDT